VIRQPEPPLSKVNAVDVILNQQKLGKAFKTLIDKKKQVAIWDAPNLIQLKS
jgi:hypothetical protein